MTDDNARYRSSDPFSSRPGGTEGQGSDPLAELARLIGQGGPFNDRARPATPQHSEPTSDVRAYTEQQPSHEPVAVPEWHNPPTLSYDQHSGGHPAPAVAAGHGYHDAPSEPRVSHSDLTFPPSAPRGYDGQALDAVSRSLQDFQPSMPPSGHGALPPHADEFYDDAPQGGRRKGMFTVAAVLCLAVVGTAAAFGYRSWFGGANAKSPPPVIRASGEPSKVAPPPAAMTDSSANKISYDRFGDRGQNEKVVLREEKPVDIKEVARSGPSRPMQAAPAAPATSAAAAPPSANPPSVLTEPKRVRTVPIRPEMEQPGVRPQMTAAPLPAPPAPSRQASVAPSNVPMDIANPSSPPAQVRASAVRQAPPPAPGNAPLSLAPDSSPPPAASARATAPTRVAAAPAGNGSYLVQVSSQRSEADAQAAFRSVKSKYGSVIGDRQPVIRRADLAGKGTYYRAMVGPFGSRDEAIQMCSSLKAAGGDCVVQSN